MIGRILLPLNTVAAVEITFRLDVVELRYDGHCAAVIDKDRLRAWMTWPAAHRFCIDEVTWTHLGNGHLRFAIRGAGVWTLPPATASTLLGHL